MGEAQLLEVYLGHFLYAAAMPELRDQVGNYFKRGSKRMMGGLIRALSHAIDVPSPLLVRLDSARRSRNWLAHRYFESRAKAFQNEGGRTAMVCELDQIGDEFYRLWSILDTALITWLRRPTHTVGCLQEDLDAAARDLRLNEIE